MLLRFLLIFLFIINLGLPLNNKIDLFLIGMLIFLIFAIIDVITIKQVIKKEKYPGACISIKKKTPLVSALFFRLSY